MIRHGMKKQSGAGVTRSIRWPLLYEEACFQPGNPEVITWVMPYRLILKKTPSWYIANNPQ